MVYNIKGYFKDNELFSYSNNDNNNNNETDNNVTDNNNETDNTNNSIPCDIDTLYYKKMKNDVKSYDNKIDSEETTENIKKLFELNKNYYQQMIKNYNEEVEISKPNKNIEILNSVYKSKYDSGLMDNSAKLTNECDNEQLEAIRNCEVNCSRNECSVEYLDIVLDNCTVDDIPQGYGETFCVEGKNNCSQTHKNYVEKCMEDCNLCNSRVSDITLKECLIDGLEQIYGKTFCTSQRCSRPSDPDEYIGYNIIESNLDPGRGPFDVSVSCSVGYENRNENGPQAHKCNIPGERMDIGQERIMEYSLEGCKKINNIINKVFSIFITHCKKCNST